MRTLLAVSLCALAIGCSSSPPAGEPDVAGEAPGQTALLSVGLERDGGVTIHTVAVKPIPWTMTSAPFDATLHAPPQGQVGWKPTVEEALPDDPVDSPLGQTQAPSAPAIRADGHAHRGAVVVEHRSRAEPFVVPLHWGQPGEGHGDVRDRWDGGAALWRVPWFGNGTRYRVVRVHPGPPAELARSVR